MRNLSISLRILLGLIFVIFSANYFFSLFPFHTVSPSAVDFILALKRTGYLYHFIQSTELIAGLLLVFDIFTPLVLVILAPITLNILLFQLNLELTYLPLGLVLVVLHLTLGLLNYSYYRPLFNRRS